MIRAKKGFQNTLKIMFLVFLTSTALAEESKDVVATKSMDLLKKMDEIRSLRAYEEHIMPKSLIPSLFEKNAPNNKSVEYIKEVVPKLIKDREINFYEIKIKSIENDITWDKINFIKFDMESVDFVNNLCMGYLHFTVSDASYRIETSALLVNGEFQLIGFFGLSEMIEIKEMQQN